MITIDKLPTSFELTDYESFVQTVQAADQYLNTKTYIYKNNLKYINDSFFHKNINQDFDSFVRNLFKEKDIVSSDEPGLTHRDLEKINSIDVILHSLPIRNPLSLNYFGNGSWGAHPGNTRLSFGDVYKKDVYAMVVDHNHSIKNDYPDEHFYELDEIKLNVNKLNILVTHTINGPNTIRIAAGKNVNYMELTDKPSAELGNPTLYDPPRIYRLKKNKTLVTVDDRIVLEKVDDKWQIYNQ